MLLRRCLRCFGPVAATLVTLSLVVKTGLKQGVMNHSYITELSSIEVSSLKIVKKEGQVRGSQPAV